MSKFKVGETVKVVNGAPSESKYIGQSGKILRITDPHPAHLRYRKMLVIDIPCDAWGDKKYRAYDDEVELTPEPDTAEYTLENWSTRELLEELLRREKEC